jgi:hypothetical protein
VRDVLFDDETWKTRWIVADADGWFGGRAVLIDPSVIGQPDDGRKLLPVNLTMARIKASPGIADHQPVSRQMDTGEIDPYGYDPRWQWQYGAGDSVAYRQMAPPHEAEWYSECDSGNRSCNGDPHLRSVAAVTGYHIQATDGDIGHVESFLVDDQGWSILYLVIDTRNWLRGTHVLVAPAAVSGIDWSSGEVRLRVTREQVRTSRAWQSEAALPEKDRADS